MEEINRKLDPIKTCLNLFCNDAQAYGHAPKLPVYCFYSKVPNNCRYITGIQIRSLILVQFFRSQ
jgi:hypothetical protein